MVVKASKIAHAAACRQVPRPSRGSREPRTPPCLPQLCLRGARADGGIPRTHILPRPLLGLRGARAILRRPRAARGLTALRHCCCVFAGIARDSKCRGEFREDSSEGLSVSLSAARGAEFRGPREPRGDSASAWVGLFSGSDSGWFQLLISTARLILTRSKRQIKYRKNFYKILRE